MLDVTAIFYSILCNSIYYSIASLYYVILYSILYYIILYYIIIYYIISY